MQRLVAVLAALAIGAPAARAYADGQVITAASPRSIGRAGTGTVADDGGGALLVNPAAIARRSTVRVQVGLAVVDDSLDFKASDSEVAERDQAGARLVPLVAAAGGIGDFVFAAAAMTSAVTTRRLPMPGALPPQPAYGDVFAARYAGLAGSLRRDTVTIGAARRFGDSVAIGVSVAGSRVAVSEQRSIDTADPDTAARALDDVALTMTAHDALVPSAVAGVMIAPPSTRLELGASVSWSATAHTTGGVAGSSADGGPTVTTSSSSASLAIPEPWTARVGARWLADHWSAELDGDLWLFRDSAAQTSWQLSGLAITPRLGGMPLELGEVPSRVSAQTMGAVRASVDIELIDGLLWATGGYAYTTAGTAPSRLSPTFGALAGHTAALGIEGTAGDFTLTLGWSRTWEPASTAASVLRLDNPFVGGSGGNVPGGRYSGAIDQLGVLLDVELWAP